MDIHFWKSSPMQAGHDLSLHLEGESLSEWLAGIIVVASAAVPSDPIYEDLLVCIRSAERWHEARQLFEQLREKRMRSVDPIEGEFLDTAEDVAKTLYNASGGPAPYDSHARWKISQDLLELAQQVGTPEFEVACWNALSSQQACH